MKLNVITLFSGYDSQCLALDRIKRHNPQFDYDLVAWAEIDPHAIKAHNALFPQWANRNLGDVSKVDWQAQATALGCKIDLLTYSSPCQDFSSAGLQKGGQQGSGTRSSLLWECERAIEQLRPKYLLFENVSALVSEKFRPTFFKWCLTLEKLGYTNFQQLMNAKDYGVPQNRLRIFMVSILDCPRAYYFPKPFKLERRLKDVLEQNVDERYYLKDEQVQKLVMNIDKKESKEPSVQILGDLQPDSQWQGSVRQQNQVVGIEGIAPACTAEHERHPYKIAEPQDNVMLGWTRSSSGKGEPTYHPVNVANCVTVAKHENTQNYVTEPQIIDTTNMGFEGEVKIYDNYTQRLELKPDGTSNTLTSVAKDNLLIEPRSKRQESIKAKVMPNGDIRCYRDVPGKPGVSELQFTHPDNESPTVTCEAQVKVIEQGIRIRRLTERELYRLMDVSEPDIDTLLAAPIPRTQHAKLAGNSIVTACMYYIFHNLFIETTPPPNTQTQLF